MSFTAPTPGSELRLALPNVDDNISLDGEPDFFDDGDPAIASRMVKLTPSGTRERVITVKREGDYRVMAEFDLRVRSGSPSADGKPTHLSANERARYLRHEPDSLPVNNRSVSRVLAEAEGKWTTQEELLEWLFEYCAVQIKQPAPGSQSDGVLGVLDSMVASPTDRAQTFATLCRAAGMPARLVAGFELRNSEEVEQRVWVEVFRQNTWTPFDPEYGYSRVMPVDHVVTRRDGRRIVRTSLPNAVTNLKTRYAIVRRAPAADALRADMKNPLQVFDLTRMPVEMHEVLKLLLLLPMGALVTALFRNVIGVPTFGTFAPALFAASFVYADWISGLVVLAVVLSAGFIGRTLIERLRLLMVPRLSIILTTIILCVVFGVSALDYLELTPSANAVLLPLVIVTTLIERIYVTIEEDGVTNAGKLALGTVVVATCCFLLLGWEAVGRTLLVYPEIHLLTIAAFIAIGRYTGYRLVELWRFRDLVDPSTN
ncbi:7TM domain-containing protein [Botrimarina hoheduenensis]|uniref:7TM domain-containing protein n=1 Tax=Botrimarina hoheduenensis TaxID=2528000 RepID=UPI0011B489B4|nr:7TM domain-containing protein [Botrimarina hoheduenensis]